MVNPADRKRVIREVTSDGRPYPGALRLTNGLVFSMHMTVSIALNQRSTVAQLG
jgi:hypothetical protein